jgi:hypothetical protein
MLLLPTNNSLFFNSFVAELLKSVHLNLKPIGLKLKPAGLCLKLVWICCFRILHANNWFFSTALPKGFHRRLKIFKINCSEFEVSWSEFDAHWSESEAGWFEFDAYRDSTMRFLPRIFFIKMIIRSPDSCPKSVSNITLNSSSYSYSKPILH